MAHATSSRVQQHIGDPVADSATLPRAKLEEIFADISQHWKVTSAAFLGGNVRGDRQFGRVGERTLLAIPILPDGSLDPAHDPVTGELIDGRQKDPKSFIPNHGDVYATALLLGGVAPKGRGRNERPPLAFILRRA